MPIWNFYRSFKLCSGSFENGDPEGRHVVDYSDTIVPPPHQSLSDTPYVYQNRSVGSQRINF